MVVYRLPSLYTKEPLATTIFFLFKQDLLRKTLCSSYAKPPNESSPKSNVFLWIFNNNFHHLFVRRCCAFQRCFPHFSPLEQLQQWKKITNLDLMKSIRPGFLNVAHLSLGCLVYFFCARNSGHKRRSSKMNIIMKCSKRKVLVHWKLFVQLVQERCF